jgi:3',5'-cyclic-AMP phosphodiesterase
VEERTLIITHVSDLHLNSFFNDDTFKKIKLLLKNISDYNVDHLVITGDLTDNADPNDFLLLRRLLKRFGFLSGEKLSITIGNHDIFGGIQKPDDIFLFGDRCRNIDYKKRISDFISYFPEAFENCEYLDKDYFPFIKIIDDVLFLGINSIAEFSIINNPFASNGEVSLNQFNTIFDLLSKYSGDYKRKLILIHHHFNKIKSDAKSSLGMIWQNIEKQTMKLKNKKRLFKLFNDFNIDMVLHGHLHESKEYIRRDTRFLNAGATIRGKHDDRISFNLIDSGNKKMKVETVELRTELGRKKEDSPISNEQFNGLLMNKDLIREENLVMVEKENI